jgi:hypothetical protein
VRSADVDAQARSLLLKTADSLETDGWLQGAYGSADGPKCMVGAMRFAHHGWVTAPGPADGYVMARALWLIESFLETEPVQYNDAPGRTAEQVVASLHLAAKPDYVPVEPEW